MRTTGWWTASLCALSAATALGLAVFWLRIIVQMADPPPPSVHSDPFMSVINRPVLWGCCFVAPVVLITLAVLRRRYQKMPPWLQAVVAGLLILGTLYCMSSYALRTEAYSRSMLLESTQQRPAPHH